MRGSPVGAAWDLEFIHSGSTVTAGIDIQDLYGTAGLRGTWDGEKVLADGQLKFDSMVYNGYQLTKIRGPFSINGKQVVIGSKEALNQNNSPDGRAPVDNIGRLTADFIGGVISLDGNVKLEKQTSYHVKITLAGGRLEQFAALYLPGQNKLRGLMNGLIDLYGKGNSPRNLEGTGRLTISPAALYELPVVVAIFKILNFGPPDKTAFRTAGFSFNIENSKCMFRRIELIGDTISLIGRGMVGFDGALALDFYSRSGRSQIPIPILREVLAETFKGFVRVTVRGTTTNPSALIQTMPQMDDALRNFLGALAGPGQNRNAQQQQPTRAASRP